MCVPSHNIKLMFCSELGSKFLKDKLSCMTSKGCSTRIQGALVALPRRAPAGRGRAGKSQVGAVGLPTATLQLRPRKPGEAGWGHSLAKEALGDGAELSPAVLDQVHLLVHHHVVKLLPLLCNHDVGIPLHAQLQAYRGGHGQHQGQRQHWESQGWACNYPKLSPPCPPLLPQPAVIYRALTACQSLS